ncbi:HAD family phosphatase [Actinophytocola sp.]|jgi:HAD superfamily hydrolase (TIGR01509 family)|uniref:HAD family hydrolase n=1 Tax=Actinophytocola sp. TaxID=1872138 RepID=UPI002EDB9CDE
MTDVRALLYDFDGLLVDSEFAGLRSWQALYDSHGHELDLEHWLGEVAAGRGPCMPIARLEELVGRQLDWADLEPVRKRHRDSLIAVRPGVLAHLDRARALGVPCAIVSNAPGWWIDEQLANTGLARDHFTAIVSKDGKRAGKPAPDSYLAALDALSVAPGDALAFEDSPVGVAAAKAAGIRCVAVPNEVTAAMPLDAADQLVSSLADVTLDELLAARERLAG